MSRHNPRLAFHRVVYEKYLLFPRRIGGESLHNFNRRIGRAQWANRDTAAPAPRGTPRNSSGGAVDTAAPEQLSS